MRTAAGRRALQVALLVGGLFALGFLFGEQAHAADGVPAVTPVTSVISTASDELAPQTPAKKPKPVSVQGPKEDVLPVGRVVETVDTVVTATTGLVDAETKLPGLPDLSDLPGLSGQLPELPGVPGAPGLPELPELPVLPGQTLPAPVTSAPQPGGMTTSSATSETKEQRARTRSASATLPTYGTAFGPTFAAGAVAADRVAHTSAHRAGPAQQAPVRHTPPDDPGGVLNGKAAADSGTPRHGDAHAVTGNHRAPLRLLAGVAARAAADGTRDRYRDIPVFPG